MILTSLYGRSEAGLAAYRTGLLIAGAIIGDDADGFMVRQNHTGGLRRCELADQGRRGQSRA